MDLDYFVNNQTFQNVDKTEDTRCVHKIRSVTA